MYAAAFVVLAVLVQATDFDRLNGFAVHHLQPLAGGKGHPRMNDAAEALIAPAAPGVAAVVVGLAAIGLWLRGRRRAAPTWPIALAAAIAVEMVSKLVIEPQLGAWVFYRMDDRGGFVGDSWHETKEDAIAQAKREFDVTIE